jgi:hypothetical protein
VYHVAAVHMSPGGSKHEHIADVIWVDDKFASGESTVSAVIDFLRKNPGQIRVSSTSSTATVQVVEATRPYIRSIKDGSVSDNLLTITRY